MDRTTSTIAAPAERRLGSVAGIASARPKSRPKRWHSTRWVYESVKRALDLFFCLVVLPAAIPVLILCALLVRASGPGPLFFVQERTGRGGRRFRMFKFRSMVPEAPSLKEEIRKAHNMSGPDFKLEDDPRVTRVGRFLRKSSLDELPQLWNVLKGDMSLVGPRPTSFDPTTYDLWHTERLEVAPGLTGLWQIARRGDIDFDDRVRLDIAYVRNRSLRLDLAILIRTIPAVLSQRGAH